MAVHERFNLYSKPKIRIERLCMRTKLRESTLQKIRIRDNIRVFKKTYFVGMRICHSNSCAGVLLSSVGYE